MTIETTAVEQGVKAAPRKLLCYELNEVPWPVIDFYLQRRPHSALASLLGNADQFSSHCVDLGELQPWSTWPTLHRGVSNEVHKINFLNQDLSNAEAWPPVWQHLNAAGVSTGIFGSLQSYPAVHHPQMRFHVPDTFAAGSETVPPRYVPFQSFNLKQTGDNKAVASRVGFGDLKEALGLFNTGIRPTTWLKVAKHLFDERRNPLYKKRRALLQPALAFDVFLDCLKNEKPQFVTFFSNHVAGIMHRYWKYSFPEDFDYTLQDTETDRFHAESILVAMDIFDAQLAELQAFSAANDYDIVILSSMGQEAIDRGEYVPELRMKDFERFIARLDPGYPVTMNLAMQPDIAFEFTSIADRDAFRALVGTLRDTAGDELFRVRYEPVGRTLSMAMARSPVLAGDGVMKVGEETCTDLGEYGLELITRDIGTGYHQPNGVFIWQRTGATPATVRGKAEARSAEDRSPAGTELPSLDQDRREIDSRRILPTLLQHFGVPRQDFMQPSVFDATDASAESAAPDAWQPDLRASAR